MLIELLDSVMVEVDDGEVVVSAQVGPMSKEQRLTPETTRRVADTLSGLQDALNAAANEVEDDA